VVSGVVGAYVFTTFLILWLPLTYVNKLIALVVVIMNILYEKKAYV
jgi:hypothetical protein